MPDFEKKLGPKLQQKRTNHNDTNYKPLTASFDKLRKTAYRESIS